MDYLPKKSMSKKNGNNVPNGNAQPPSNDPTERLFAGILDSFPSWDLNAGIVPTEPRTDLPPPRNEFFMNDFMGPLAPQPEFTIPPIGTGIRTQKHSPESSNNSTLSCGSCEVNASIRCLDCNEFMCKDCSIEHAKSPMFIKHTIVALPAPIGTSPPSSNGVPSIPPQTTNRAYICEQHNEVYRFVCDSCKKPVCQCCTLHEHKEHIYISIPQFMSGAKFRVDSAMESNRMGTKCIKSSIDKALAFIRHIERCSIEACDAIRKSFRQFIMAIEDRERLLLEFVDKVRQRRLASLHEQMAGLKSALSGLAETNDTLNKVIECSPRLNNIDIAMKIANCQRQLEQFAGIYKDLQPKQEAFIVTPPDYNLLQEIRNQGSVVLIDEFNVPLISSEILNGASTSDVGALVAMSTSNTNGSALNGLRRPIQRESIYRNLSPVMSYCGSTSNMQNPGQEWEITALSNSPGLHFGAPRSNQAIPGSSDHLKARKSNGLSLSFATEGHEDGQVSRPWGVCVDKMGNILVSDRRNNRVQVFTSDGQLKFKFGRKGVGNGEFDLPAGICVDVDNRIIVVDKDNHRVQIFTSSGVFLLKFGSYGKEYGQFQYPWDVAVNSRCQIVVTDSRNHRIQQFDSEGRFIRQIVFDNHGQNKGIASPRGVCYTPTGNVIVSDFDNHCLYLIDPDINEIIATKGHEGSGFQEFNRPSGICCDDDGRIIVADSKNQRIIVFSPNLEYLWDIEVRPSMNPTMPPTLDEKDRTCDVAIMPDGRLVFLIELSPDSKEGSNPYKRFVHLC